MKFLDSLLCPFWNGNLQRHLILQWHRLPNVNIKVYRRVGANKVVSNHGNFTIAPNSVWPYFFFTFSFLEGRNLSKNNLAQLTILDTNWLKLAFCTSTHGLVFPLLYLRIALWWLDLNLLSGPGAVKKGRVSGFHIMSSLFNNKLKKDVI